MRSTHRGPFRMSRIAPGRQRAIAHPKTKIERGVPDLFRSSMLLSTSRLANQSNQCVLVRHKVSLQDGHVAVVEAMDRHTLEP